MTSHRPPAPRRKAAIIAMERRIDPGPLVMPESHGTRSRREKEPRLLRKVKHPGLFRLHGAHGPSARPRRGLREDRRDDPSQNTDDAGDRTRTRLNSSLYCEARLPTYAL